MVMVLLPGVRGISADLVPLLTAVPFTVTVAEADESVGVKAMAVTVLPNLIR